MPRHISRPRWKIYSCRSTYINSYGKEFGVIADPEEWLQYYMDDILIMATTTLEGNWYNKIFLRCCELNDRQVNWKKCEPEVTEVMFCGFLISETGVSMDPDKYALISGMKPPTTPAKVSKVVAWIQFSVEHYCRLKEIMEPIPKLAQKAEPWDWGRDQKKGWADLQVPMPEVLKPFQYDQ
jgi:hypothetical protein